MQIKIRITPLRMAYLKQETTKGGKDMEEKGILIHYWWKCKIAWVVLRKMKMEIPYDPVIPRLGICSENMKMCRQKDLGTPMFNAAFYTRAKSGNQPTCPSRTPGK